MGRIVAAVAMNTVRELVRSKLLYNLLLFAVLFIGASLFVAQLTIGNWNRVILDMGLGTIEVAGVLVAVMIGVGIVAGEIERKTIFPTLAKPVPRWAFVLGRYAGLVAILAVNVAVMLAVLAIVLRLAGYSVSATTAEATLLLFFELALMAAVAVFFASFTTPMLATAFALSVFLIGHLLGDLRTFGDRSKSAAARVLSHGLYQVLPDLELLNLKSHASNELSVHAGFVWTSVGYGCAYAAILLMLAILIFQRRDLK
jgi:ABC-type transport system involved in multi-copper enzyme maturation permease subunit